jgi:putative hemolysin
MPPLLKGYLRSGALVGGAPYWDEQFNCADLLLHLDLSTIEARYARRFLGAGVGMATLQ